MCVYNKSNLFGGEMRDVSAIFCSLSPACRLPDTYSDRCWSGVLPSARLARYASRVACGPNDVPVYTQTIDTFKREHRCSVKFTRFGFPEVTASASAILPPSSLPGDASKLACERAALTLLHRYHPLKLSSQNKPNYRSGQPEQILIIHDPKYVFTGSNYPPKQIIWFWKKVHWHHPAASYSNTPTLCFLQKPLFLQTWGESFTCKT